ncbi:hypothetical protein [Marinibactrum halimedae]|uniref:Chemotaxis protein CheC n=1 Tax=Marinibactrum halimedae TaxID=1444977 RepID=A0AA37T510_9GAMM|nr:hypothetical protein [Marinibactrum halimedae]MCD9457493.1 hypothetical protein [Marinibactrum halimedae]GLS25453.1 hypothetical protein GCM10007877_11670 [Marinibactrum halimedae]
MIEFPLDDDQKDCLQEVCNVAMGVAGESLAAFTHAFVELSIPKIRSTIPSELASSLGCVNDGGRVYAAVQPFTFKQVECFALTVFTQASIDDLMTVTGREELEIPLEDAKRDLLLKACNAISSSCLPNLSHALEIPISFSEPYSCGECVTLSELVLNDIASWGQLLSVEINYHLEDHPFNCDLLLLFPDVSFNGLTQALNELMAF